MLAERLLPRPVDGGRSAHLAGGDLPALTDLDDAGLVSRTIAELPAAGLGARDASSGKRAEVAYLYLDDDSAPRCSRASTTALADARWRSSSPTASFTADDKDFASSSPRSTKAKPDAVVLAPRSAAEQTKALITALTAAGLGGEKLWLTSENLADYSQALPAGTLAEVNGVLEGAAAG